jgi:hypothetical protein
MSSRKMLNDTNNSQGNSEAKQTENGSKLAVEMGSISQDSKILLQSSEESEPREIKRLPKVLRWQNGLILGSISCVKRATTWTFRHFITIATFATALTGITTIFLSVIKPAEVIIEAGSFIVINPEQKCQCDGYNLVVPVSMFNDGAKPGIIQRVGLVIKDSTDNSNYRYFYKSNTDQVLKSGERKAIWQLNSAFNAVIIPPREAINRNFSFKINVNKFFPNREYTFWILAWDKEGQIPSYRKEFKFSFDQQDIDRVEKIRKLQKIQKNVEKDEPDTAISLPENAKYGPVTGGIDSRVYRELTGSN